MSNFYSSNGVDRFISPLLPEFGYAVEVGANDGIGGSNAKHFEDKGWVVLCVEPNPKLVEIGKSHRKLWAQVGAGAERKEGVEFKIMGGPQYGSFSGFHVHEVPANLEFHREKWAEETVTVTVETLDNLLAAYDFLQLDLLTIDVEGHELEVLKGLDFSRWRPRVIVAEAWDQKAKEALTDYLGRAGYRFLKAFDYDLVFSSEPA